MCLSKVTSYLVFNVLCETIFEGMLPSVCARLSSTHTVSAVSQYAASKSVLCGCGAVGWDGLLKCSNEEFAYFSSQTSHNSDMKRILLEKVESSE